MNFLPSNFLSFKEPIEKIMGYSPSAVGIVGSYGDSIKTPTAFSDLDIIFSFQSQSIVKIVTSYIDDLKKINNLVYYPLGNHLQFGHLISMYFENNPMRWLDVGIMDENFSDNYLVGDPLTIVFGKISTCGMLTGPIDRMHHLARKIISAKKQNKTQDVIIFCFRYLEWWKKHLEILKRKENVSVPTKPFLESLAPEDLELNTYYSSLNLSSSADKVVYAILNDIQNRFPNVYAVCDC